MADRWIAPLVRTPFPSHSVVDMSCLRAYRACGFTCAHGEMYMCSELCMSNLEIAIAASLPCLRASVLYMYMCALHVSLYNVSGFCSLLLKQHVQRASVICIRCVYCARP